MDFRDVGRGEGQVNLGMTMCTGYLISRVYSVIRGVRPSTEKCEILGTDRVVLCAADWTAQLLGSYS